MSEYVCPGARGPVRGTVQVPGSKGITNRALICAALADGVSILRGVLLADDTRRMLEGLTALGVPLTLDEADRAVEITGCRGHLPAEDAKIDCGLSGTTLRFGMAVAALGFGRFEFDGAPRLRDRPVDSLAEALQRLGAGIEYLEREGAAPLAVHATGLRGGEVTMTGPVSSQFLSAILLAAPAAAADVLIAVEGGLPSRPYVDMTTAVLEAFGVVPIVQHEADGARCIIPAPQRYQPCVYDIEPDATSAGYFLAAAALTGGSVTVEGLGRSSIQGDICLADLLTHMGCRVDLQAQRISVEGPAPGTPLRALDVDLNSMPDLVQTVAVMALFAEGPTCIRNVANLRYKETDRLYALHTELSKLGATVALQPDGLVITPPPRPRPAAIDTYDDHRMAMNFALAGLRLPGMTIRDPQCCTKTFPEFFTRLEALCG